MRNAYEKYTYKIKEVLEMLGIIYDLTLVIYCT
jgi:hypothetical protein